MIKYQDSEASLFQSNDSSRVEVWKFILPKLNVKAKAFYQLVNLDQWFSTFLHLLTGNISKKILWPSNLHV